MANISSMMSTTNTTSTYQSNGIAGLASGMDTEAVVEAMTSDIQAKIDKIKQQQTKYEWKQDAYREVITLLTEFQDKYFSYSNPSTNLMSSALYNCVSKSAQGANADKITVTSANNNAETAYTVTGVKQLATKAQYIGESAASIGGITTGAISFDNRDTNTVAGKDFTFKYDNVEYTITIPEDANISKENQAADLAAALNKALAGQNVSGSNTKLSERLKFEANGDKLSMKTVSETDNRSFEIVAGNSQKVLEALGFTAGDKGNSATAITGKTAVNAVVNQEFSLEGKKLSFDYNGLSKTIAFDQADNDFVMGYERNEKGEIVGNADDAIKNDTTLNDEEKAARIEVARMERMKTRLQDKIDVAFGENKIEVSVKEGNKLNFDTEASTSTLAITSTTLDTLGKNGIFGIEKGTSNRLNTNKTLKELGVATYQKEVSVKGEDGKTTTEMKNFCSITVNGKTFEFGEDTQLSTVLNRINSDAEAGVNISYLNTTNKFSITADEYGAAEKINISGAIADKLFGGYIGEAPKTENQSPDSGNADGGAATQADTAVAAAGKFTAGKDLVMSIKYVGDENEITLERNSNNVTLDGVNFTVNEEFGYDANGVRDTSAEAVSFKNESDTENAVKVIKEMATAYNAIVDKINEYVTTKQARTSSGKNGSSTYEPLTEAQKKEMSEDEIKNWEKKAKEGILFGDSTLRQIASELRFAFSYGVGDYGFASDIGINVATSYSGNGKITIDEAKLSEALKNDPERVKAMFIATEEDAPNTTGYGAAGGFLTRVKGIMEDAAKTTGSYKGKLVELAGLKNNATTDNNYIARQMKMLTNRLDYFEGLLSSRRARYQQQFTSLEKYISQMNSQSAYLASTFSY